MDADEIKEKVREIAYLYSQHADIERRADNLTFGQIEEALLQRQILEGYQTQAAARVAWSWVSLVPSRFM